ncbi:MAG: 7-carboxy-7-deazaguanine synthase QueE [Schleiferiaceae bacterium]|jgi:7-carboxy-7-deazaguanine synthase|nr:7-carboxy-7-deazaguanine synthase QueE [Schleiferiaceae bacterium]MDP4833796.1 7-carboxy-7-deazaguanine synthase QueE [Schleiferiaceae bacterium]MDP5014635.1 7-carboxy-7-deazaguanine synthase QueE [Schleiferiaceae bacterium]
MEAFRTVQGEGAHTGRPSFFMRIGGCDVGCHWCDVKESWDAQRHPLTSLDELLELPGNQDSIVVITGGEPLMWDMGPLTEGLRARGFRVHLETSGAYPVTGSWDWVCLSPKKTKAPLVEWYALANELKVIIFNDDDFKWAAAHAEQCSAQIELFVQPEWSRRDQNIPKIIDFLESNPQWRLGLQTHKYIGMP